MVNTARVNPDHDFNPLADHMAKLRNFTKSDVSAFRFSLYVML